MQCTCTLAPNVLTNFVLWPACNTQTLQKVFTILWSFWYIN